VADVLNVNDFSDQEKQYRYFLNNEPVAIAEYSLYIYLVTLEEVNRVRREMSLPEIPVSSDQKTSK